MWASIRDTNTRAHPLLTSDQLGDGAAVRLAPVLRAARLPALRREEADHEREQGAGDRLQRLPADLLRLHLPGRVHGALPPQHLQRGAADQGARGRQQRHRLHRGLHRPRAAQPSHHSGQ